MPVIQKETDRHTRAFEKYFECRCISEVARDIGVSRQSIDKWRVSFLWDDRVILREKKISERLENKVIDGIVDKKAKMLQELDNMDIMVDQGVITAFEKDESGKVVLMLPLEKIKDLIDLFKLKLSINDNRLRVLGEDIHNVDITGTIEHKTDLEETLKKYGEIFKEEED